MKDSKEKLTTLHNKINELVDDEDFHLLEHKMVEFTTLMSYYKCAMMEVETKFKVLNQEYSMAFDRNPINSIKTRLKSPLSIKEKIERKGLPISVESIENNLKDVAGIRVVCSFIDDVYTLTEAFLDQDDIILIEKKDYIASPKENGYRSLHLIVEIPIFLADGKRMMKAEIQLRTIAMDFWASLEHQLRYKKDHIFTEEMAKELLDCAEQSAILDRKMNHLRNAVDSQQNES